MALSSLLLLGPHVSSLDGPYVLGSWIADDPDGGAGFERREVSDELAEVIVVTSLELVLDHNSVARLVLAD